MFGPQIVPGVLLHLRNRLQNLNSYRRHAVAFFVALCDKQNMRSLSLRGIFLAIFALVGLTLMSGAGYQGQRADIQKVSKHKPNAKLC